jgi:hypothetical protein
MMIIRRVLLALALLTLAGVADAGIIDYCSGVACTAHVGSAATIGVEHTVATINAPADYIFCVDLANMASGDTVELRVKNRILAGGTTRGYYIETFTGAQPTDTLIVCSIPFRVQRQGITSIKQTTGTGRLFPWELWKVD